MSANLDLCSDLVREAKNLVASDNPHNYLVFELSCQCFRLSFCIDLQYFRKSSIDNEVRFDISRLGVLEFFASLDNLSIESTDFYWSLFLFSNLPRANGMGIPSPVKLLVS